MYATFAKEGIVKNVSWYYLNRNGRYWINVLDSALLSYGRTLFIIVNPLVIMAFIVFLAKNIQLLSDGTPDKAKERTYIRYGMVLFACVDVMCLRETVFWITGMMNYLFPATLFLIAIWAFLKMRGNPNPRLWAKIGYFILCAFAASSVEQYALMFVGFCTVVLGADFIRKEKSKVHLTIGYILSIAALALLFLAPGNLVRVEEQNNASLLNNVWTLLCQNTVSNVAYPFMLMLVLLCCVAGYYKKQKTIVALGAAAICSLTAIVLFPTLEKAIIIIFATFICGLLFGCCIIKFRKMLSIELFAVAVVGLGSQIMLLVSDIWGYRCMFSMYIMHILLIGVFLSQIKRELNSAILLLGILAAIHPTLMIATSVIMLLLRNNLRVQYNIVRFCIACATIFALLTLFIGYYNNTSQHRENIDNTLILKENRIIKIYELEDETYSWYTIPMNEFHEGYYRRYYNIPDSAEIEYIEK